MNIISTLLLAGGLALGCASKEDKAAVEPKQTGTVATEGDKAKKETKEAAGALRDYAYAQKADFVAEMKKDMVGMQAELDRLSVRVEGANAGAKADATKALDAVREKWAQANKQLELAESATESTWDDVKAGFRKSHGELKTAFSESRQWLSDKIAP